MIGVLSNPDIVLLRPLRQGFCNTAVAARSSKQYLNSKGDEV